MANDVKSQVLAYVHEHPNETEDDIARELRLNVIDVLNALVQLEKEGSVKGI